MAGSIAYKANADKKINEMLVRNIPNMQKCVKMGDLGNLGKEKCEKWEGEFS